MYNRTFNGKALLDNIVKYFYSTKFDKKETKIDKKLEL